MLNPVRLDSRLIGQRAALLAALLHQACALDVQAAKPGNVSLRSAGHGMSAQDFLASADAIIAPMTRAEASIGQRILASISATGETVQCNTNLGIVLLCAPLTHAALALPAGGDMRVALDAALDGLTLDDAERAYAAIRLAGPAGLGSRAEHDVAAQPRVDLRTAMAAAQEVDLIARQYANGFEEVFATQPTIATLRRRWNDEPRVAVAVYLELLARNPDSHIVRKHGMETALRVSHEALPFAQSMVQSADPREFEEQLDDWDVSLKLRGINPGTTADLTVASFYLNGILSIPELELTASGAFAPPMAIQPWEQSRILAN